MDGFEDVETMAMYPSTLPPYDLVQTSMIPGYDLEPNYQFDLESFAGSDVAQGAGPTGLHPFGNNNYDDAFSDVVSTYDQQFSSDQPLPENNPALDRDNKLLSFSIPTFPYGLLDFTYRRAAISLSAQLNGMFFMADPPTSSGDDTIPDSRVAVTCYRRNLFSITGSVTIPRSLRYVSTDQGEQIPIVPNEIALSATESIEGASVKLISVPFKSAITSGTVEERADKEPHTVPLDLMNGAEMDPEFATFPLSWKRLQFRASTANNGRRKELQQHFVIHIGVMATLPNGHKISICDVASTPIVVRGRSPRNFQARKDTNGSGSRPKGSLPRRATMDSIGRINAARTDVELGIEDHPNFAGITSDPWSWKQPNGQGAVTTLPPDNFRIPHNDFFPQSSPDLSRYSSNPTPAPVTLSLEDEDSKKPSPLSGTRDTPSQKKAPRLSTTGRPPSFSLASSLQSGDNDDATDQLYEYFPLGLDDWQEPVDAVYRPHVVHHINLPTDARAGGPKNRSKRLFSYASP